MNYSQNPDVLFIPTFKKVFTLLTSKVIVNINKHGIKNCEAILVRNEIAGFTLEINSLINDIDDKFDVEIMLGDKLLTAKNASIIYIGRDFKRNNTDSRFTIKSTSKVLSERK